MIDQFTEGSHAKPNIPAHIEAQQQGLIRVKNALFTWGSARGESTPDFKLRIPDVTFEKGKINIIAGPTGSGKSSFLKVNHSSFRRLIKLISPGPRRRVTLRP